MKRIAILSAAILVAAVALVGMPTRAADEKPTFIPITVALSSPTPEQFQAAARDAVSPDPDKSAAAIQSLRAAGQAGLDALFTTHAAAIKQAMVVTLMRDATGKMGAGAPTPEQLRLRNAIDSVAMQRDAIASRLYWYTDLESAKAAAVRENKPILSLRMLGKLNDDLSCANSRFFRTTLYSNEVISAILRNRFILHWESVRPVPVITIDMGDGRKIVRTITGNSIHYILDSQGRVVDALPGLYGADKFLRELDAIGDIAASMGQLNDVAFNDTMKQTWKTELTGINQAWTQDLVKVGAQVPMLPVPVQPVAAPNAVQAMPRAVSKSFVEAPMLAQIMPQPDVKAFSKSTTDELWAKIAALHTQDAAMDDSTKALITLKSPDIAVAAMQTTVSKRAVENPMLKMMHNLQDSIALDSVKNEYEMHTKIYEWMIAEKTPVVLKDFNEKVYADLFLTPSADKWLGLVPADTFSALDNDGLCTTTTTIAAH